MKTPPSNFGVLTNGSIPLDELVANLLRSFYHECSTKSSLPVVMRGIPISEIYHVLVKYRGIPSGVIDDQYIPTKHNLLG